MAQMNISLPDALKAWAEQRVAEGRYRDPHLRHDLEQPVVDRLAMALERLAGVGVTRVKPAIRCLSYRSHRIFYVFGAAEERIVRILHHAMNAHRHLLQ
jgi:plasmid stabilization system protein ParE